MAAEFTPLFPSVRAKLSSAAASPGQFSPVTPVAGSTSKTESTGNTTFTAKPSLSPIASHNHTDLSIELKRDGDRISQIRIQCRCGEVIELDCEY